MSRSEEPRLSNPIIPEPDVETAAQYRGDSGRRRRSRAARTRPLWLACLLLLLGLVGLSAYYWFDRQEWQDKQRDLSGQLSNMHARLDSLDDRSPSPELENNLADLAATQQTLQSRQQSLSDDLRKLSQRSAEAESLEKLNQAVQDAEEQRATLEATIAAVRRSLSILETSGGKAREALQARLDEAQGTRQDLAQRLGALDEALEGVEQRLQSLGDEGLSSIEERQDSLASQLAELEDTLQESQSRWERLSARIESNQASLAELRQGQLAINASLEDLRTRVD